MKLKNIINLAKMKTAKNKQIAVNWLSAFNTKNLQNLLSLYHASARHYSPKLKIAKPDTNGYIAGKEELALWWEEAFTKLPDLFYELKKLIVDENSVFIEYIRKTEGQADLKVGKVLEIENDLIVFSSVYHG